MHAPRFADRDGDAVCDAREPLADNDADRDRVIETAIEPEPDAAPPRLADRDGVGVGDMSMLHCA